jgi:translocation and assembly module TamB
MSKTARLLRHVGKAIGLVVVFVVSLVAGTLVHLNTPTGRRLVVAEVDAILAPSFRGKITIRHLGHVGLLGISGTDATIDDPLGHDVVSVKGLRVGIATLAAIRSALLDQKNPLTVDLSGVALDSADVSLDTDAAGRLELLDAFDPATPASPPHPSDPTARGFRLAISSITLRQGWAHGRMAGAPPLDVHLADVRGAFTIAPDAIEADLGGAKIEALRLVGDAGVVGSLQAHLRMPSAAGAQPDVRADWKGTVGGIAESVRGSFASGAIDAVVDVTDASPASIRTLWPDSPIDRPARLHLEAHGPLAGVGLALHASLGNAALDADGQVKLQDEKTGRLNLHARHVDVRELAASAPTTRLGLDAEVTADMKPDGALSGTVALHLLAGSVGTTATPAASVHADGARTHDGQLRAAAEVGLDEPGAPTKLTAQLTPEGPSSIVAFRIESNVADFERVPQLGHAVHGSARLSATGRADITRETIDVQLDAQASDVSRETTQVQSITVKASAHGPLQGPEVDAAVSTRGVVVGGLRFVSADATARGSAMSPHVTATVRGPDTPDIDVAVDLGLQNGLSLRGVRADLSQGDVRAQVTARSVKLGGGDVRVDDARIEGLGAPLTATIAMSGSTMRVQTMTTGFDLARVGRLAHLGKKLQAGTVAIDADLNLRCGEGDGRLVLDIAHVKAGTATDVSARADMFLAARTLVAKVHAEAAGVGVLDVAAPKVTLAGAGALTSASWREAFGSVDVSLRADLAKLAALVPSDDLPFSEARGDVKLRAHLARDDTGDLTPDVDLELGTQNLVLAPRVPVARDIDGVLVHPAPAWRLEGIDFDVDGTVNGRSGAVSTTTQARDAKGALARLDVSSDHFPFADVFHDTGRLMADLQTTALRLNVAVPQRHLASLPAMLRQHYVTGHVQGNVEMTGTMRAPLVSLDADLTCAGLAGEAITAPLDVNVTAHYDGRRATGSIKARSHDHEMFDLETQLDAVAAAFLDARGTTPPWTGSARAHLDAFPMEQIAALDDKQVAGKLSGDVVLEGVHADARVDADMSVEGLSVGSIAYRSARAQLKADGKVIDAALRVDQTDGFGEIHAHAKASWGAALAPSLDPSQPLDGTLVAKNLRIAAFRPFVAGVIDELDGRLDGNTRIELDPHERTAKLSGALTLTRGTVEAAAGGGELHDIAANIAFAPDGTITLQRLVASGMNGRLQAVGTAHLWGTTLQSARATLTIPGNSAIPLAVGGVELGDVDGRVDVTVSSAPGGRAMDVEVEVPKLDVKLTESSTGSPQTLGAMDSNVRIGAHRGDPVRFVLLPLDPGPKVDTSSSAKPGSSLVIATHLADVHVVRGTQLKIDLDGHVAVRAGDETKVTGQIQLRKGGLLDVQGRAFTVESGTVTFVGDPGNPEIVVRASWTAPDATVVTATFTGPLKTGKVTLSSRPQLPKEEIVQLLLFGSADGTQAQTPSSSTESGAIATAGGEAAQPLNHMLDQLGLGAVSAKIDTSQAATPKPEVEVQIAKDISLQIAVVLGQPPPGVNPDHTLLTLDWRFRSMWSLATTVGDAGTTIFDLLWQRRY